MRTQNKSQSKTVGWVGWTRVSGDYIQVKIVHDTKVGRMRYSLMRLDTGNMLRRLRGAGALHNEKGPWETKGPLAPVAVAPKVATRVQTMPPPANEVTPSPSLEIPPPPKKAATMSRRSQSELLTQLSRLTPDTRRFLSELIDATAPIQAAASEVRARQ